MTKNNLWVFGDSYADVLSIKYVLGNKYEDISWNYRLASVLNLNIKNLGCSGTSLEYVYFKFDEVKDQICENDVVILVLTNLDRRWIVRDKPNVPPWQLDSSELRVFKYLLDFPELYKIYLQNFLINVAYLTKKLNLHTILIPCFDNTAEVLHEMDCELPFHIANGTLLSVSEAEFINPEDHKTLKLEPRLNHIINSNHGILANKIVDNINRKIPIDLTTDFINGVIDSKLNIDNDVFRDREFYLDIKAFSL